MFQFQCPRCTSILQADAAQAGQTSQCPICQTPFIIPAPVVPAARAAASASLAQPPGPATPAPVNRPPSWPVGAGIPRRPEIPTFSQTPLPRQRSREEPREPDLLHIPCPQCKQLLETPLEMLDQEVRCPYCQAQFQLRRRDSVESRRQRQQEQELRDRKAGRSWLNYAIAAVVFVVLFLLFLIFSSARAQAGAVCTTSQPLGASALSRPRVGVGWLGSSEASPQRYSHGGSLTFAPATRR